MGLAYHLAQKLLPEHSCKFSRHDFTLAQLFACLVIREHFGLSFRRAEALLADSPQWLTDIGLSKTPDHNTLWRAFELLISTRRCNRIHYVELQATLKAFGFVVQTDYSTFLALDRYPDGSLIDPPQPLMPRSVETPTFNKRGFREY